MIVQIKFTDNSEVIISDVESVSLIRDECRSYLVIDGHRYEIDQIKTFHVTAK